MTNLHFGFQFKKKYSGRISHLLDRKQPLWLHKVAQYQLFRDLMKLIKSESDVTIIVPSLLLLVSILPALAAKVNQLCGLLPITASL